MNIYTTDKIRNVALDMGEAVKRLWQKQWHICPELPPGWGRSMTVIP